MAELLSTLPGDIPGLLLRGSPVLVTIDSDAPPVRGVVLEPEWEPAEADPRCLVWNERNGRDNKAKMFVALDLTDATGRAHAAWWASERIPAERIGSRSTSVCSGTEWHEVQQAVWNQPMTPTQIDTLARLCLRLAGRSHV